MTNSVSNASKNVIDINPAYAGGASDTLTYNIINIAAADATIAGFDSKYTYNLWRPYHAIRLADTDGNPDTIADPTWNSLFTAPQFQEYMANHAVITTAFMSTVAELLGDKHTFTLSSTGYPSFTWTFNRFSDAAAQVIEARIWPSMIGRSIRTWTMMIGVSTGTTTSQQDLHHSRERSANRRCDAVQERRYWSLAKLQCRLGPWSFVQVAS